MKPLYESLKLFYLGKEEDNQSHVFYKNKHLTTHAVVIGMTGSGKTGLGIDIIEEASIDNIPSIIIDPKGDMGNLLLTFPNLQTNDFIPWVSSSENNKEKIAEETAQLWSNGIQEWDQDSDRIARLKNSADFTIYTPGSETGVGISMLKTFDLPSKETILDSELLNTYVSSMVTSILDLGNIKSDSLTGVEHILISNIFYNEFRNNNSLSIENLIALIINPPFKKIGVFDLEKFIDTTKRTELAMRLNALIANPSFGAWQKGEVLDIDKILFTKDGKARVSIFSISHLNDKERMFFVNLLLNKFISWMRHQEGVENLKAIIYMDEIFGFFPPIGNPPSKQPMLTLLKQARAYGVGVILSTQNPVDLDYKGLSNIGTWFIGKLQTSQDKQKVIGGLKGIQGSAYDEKELLEIISNLPKRTFLMKNIHEDGLKILKTRWTLSYLKGPLSKEQISFLMKDKKSSSTNIETQINPPTNFTTIPILSNKISQKFSYSRQSSPHSLIPYIVFTGKIRFFDAKREIDKTENIANKYYLDLELNSIPWDESEVFDDLIQASADNNTYGDIPNFIIQLSSLSNLEKYFGDYIYRNNSLTLYKAEQLNIESNLNESIESFKLRLQDELNKKIDNENTILINDFEKNKAKLLNNLQKAQIKLEKEEADVKTKTLDTVISVGSSIISTFLGKNFLTQTTVRKTAASTKSVGRVLKEKNDVVLAKNQVLSIHEELENLTNTLEENINAINEKYVLNNIEIKTFNIKPRRTDIFDIKSFILWKEI